MAHSDAPWYELVATPATQWQASQSGGAVTAWGNVGLSSRGTESAARRRDRMSEQEEGQNE